jgi:hypothetical protein
MANLIAVTYAEFGKHMINEYNKEIKSIADPQKRAEAMQPIWEYVDSLETVDTTGAHALKSVVSVMKTAKDQFATLVSHAPRLADSFLRSTQAAAFHNLEQIEVVGAIIYTGPDPAARQTSTIFGGSTLLQEMLTNTRSDVRKLIDRLTTDIKWVA